MPAHSYDPPSLPGPRLCRAIDASFWFDFDDDGTFLLDCRPIPATVARLDVLADAAKRDSADSQIACSFDTMVGIATGKMTLPSAVIGGLFKVKGNKNILRRLAPLIKEAMRELTKSLQVCCRALSIPKPP